MDKKEKDYTVPVWKKYALTLEEAAQYYGIGINKLREVVDQNDRYMIMVGKKRLVKRELFAQFLDTQRVL